MNKVKYDFSIIFKEVEEYKKNNPDFTLHCSSQINKNVDLDEVKKLSQMCYEMHEQEDRGVIYNTFS
ncbi:hypothetical protein [Proteiniphilum propionicum]|jgi:hypothetical protein|uniref:hypothetical protein n=1 Tax=Proteiniphilum propionicum TaxID=2829812 RepID=UPI001EEB2D0F|nr:hypothetical protein [Proteiniphilum propionicum]ULB35631.1 hypothetical protein KDN43_06255 [Proteiniphilum propionicum]